MSDDPLSLPNCAKGRATVTTTTLNVRAGPGVKFARVGQLPQGETVDVWAVEEGWYWVQAQTVTPANKPRERLTGWVSAELVRVVGELVA